jgi:threonine dehydrogenase-like Zn-dependent dehydrogenase
MKAVCWMGKQKMEVREVPDPSILNAEDCIVRVTSSAICGSDLHLYNGFLPMMEPGDVMGHEFMGEVVDVGPNVRRLHVGDRVVVPFPISCGRCEKCRNGLFSVCENSNPNAWLAEKLLGQSPAGIFGYSHLTGGFAGGQAEYVRVPYADVGGFKVPPEISDEKVLFLSDILPTGYMAADMCNIRPGDTVAVWGCGPVGQFAIASAYLLGAEKVIAIDRFEYRLEIARQRAGAITVNYMEVDSVVDVLKDLTGGRGPDHCIDAVGAEGHTHGVSYLHDRAKQMMRMQTDRPIALRQAILACAPGGTVSVVGVYTGLIDKFPMNAVMNKGLSIKTGQCHVHRYMEPLFERITRGEIDPSFVITHRMPLDRAAEGYEMFNQKENDCEKIVLKVA